MIDTNHYIHLKAYLDKNGYADEFKWAQGVKPCRESITFCMETCWVIINAGMKEQVARGIWNRIKSAWGEGRKAADVFGHKGKSAAIDMVWKNRARLFKEYSAAKDKLGFLLTIPWIGPITVYRLARNLGLDYAKPDRHLVRITKCSGESPQQLCERLSKATGDRIGAVDCVIWRAANLQLV